MWRRFSALSPAGVCSLVRDLGWAGQRTALGKLEPKIRPVLRECQGKQLSFLLYQCAMAKAGSREMYAEMWDLLLPKLGELDSASVKNTLMGLIDMGDRDRVSAYAKAINKATISAPDLAVLIFNSHRSPSPDLVCQLVERLQGADLSSVSTMLLAMALHGLNKANWQTPDPYLQLMNQYAKVNVPPRPREYAMALIGASKHFSLSPAFCSKLQTDLSVVLPIATPQGICNICHAASRFPALFPTEQWIQISQRCMEMKEEIVGNALNLTTVLHAFNKAKIELEEWKKLVTEQVVEGWNPTQVAVGTFSLREELVNSTDLCEILFKGVARHIGAMSAKHRLNMLLLWSDSGMYREDRWTVLQRHIETLTAELRDTEHNGTALNQVLSISFRIQKYRSAGQNRYDVTA